MSTGVTRSDKINRKIAARRISILNRVIRAAVALAAVCAILIVLNFIVIPFFGYKFELFSGHPRLLHLYSDSESTVLDLLLKETVRQNSIPQFEFLSRESGFEDEKLLEIIGSLADRGDIALGDSGVIVDIYPWTSRQTGIEVYLYGGDYQAVHRLNAAGALYAMSVSSLYGLGARIVARLNYADSALVVVVQNHEIVSTNNLAAVVYKTDDYMDSRFFISAEEARVYYRDNFEVSRVIRLDRGLVMGDIIANEIKGKIEK